MKVARSGTAPAPLAHAGADGCLGDFNSTESTVAAPYVRRRQLDPDRRIGPGREAVVEAVRLGQPKIQRLSFENP
ncbi:hypothetical protein GCM10010505_75280 [Kitasatospora aburaviensis]